MMLLNCVLEKTLESPLDCKEIQPVYPVFVFFLDVESGFYFLFFFNFIFKLYIIVLVYPKDQS